MNKKGFTLIEALISVTLTGMILITAYSAFQSVMTVQGKLSNSITIQKNLFYLSEKITSLIRAGGTLDYEEYFNRKMLGYNKDFVGTEYTFKDESKFGNGGTLHKCMVDNSTTDECLESGNVVPVNSSVTSIQLTGDQKYGQYAALGLNYGTEATTSLGYATPNQLPPIIDIGDPLISNGLPELYLIKKLTDGNFERTYFRHVYVSYPSPPICIPGSTPSNCLGKLQMTKLTSCDEDANGVIEKWVAHPDFGSENCTTASPTSTLVWIDITPPDIDVISARFLPYPYKIPSLMSGSGEEASAPSIQMRLEMGISKLKPTALSSSGDTRIMMTTIHLND